MNKYKKLISNSSLFLVANFGSKILSFLLVRFYTEILSTSEYGIIDVVNTTAGLSFPLVTLCITDAVLRFSISDVDNRKEVFSTGFFVITVGNIFFLVISPLLRMIEFFDTNYWMIYLITLSNSVYMLVAHFARGIGKSKLFALSGVIHTVAQIALNFIFLLGLKMGVTGYLLSMVLSNLLVTLIIFVVGKLQHYIVVSIKKQIIKGMLIYALPLIPNSVFWWIMQSADRYTILYMLSSSNNGLYSVANKIPTIIATLSSIFFQAWQITSVDEALSSDKDKFYSNVFSGCSILITLFTSLIIAFIQPIFRILVEPSYFNGWKSAPFLLLAMVFSCYSSFLGTNYIVMKRTKGVFLTTVIGALINVVLNILLTPIWGIKGTAIATFTAFLVTWIVRAIDTRKFVKISYPIKNFVIPTALILFQAILMTVEFTSIIIQLVLSLLILICYGGSIHNIWITISNYFLKRKRG